MEKQLAGVLLDIDYETKDSMSIVHLYIKTKEGIQKISDTRFSPYFYAVTENITDKQLQDLKTLSLTDGTIKTVKLIKENTYKIAFSSTNALLEGKYAIKSLSFVKQLREHDIPFTKRYLIDNQLTPMNAYLFHVTEQDNGYTLEKVTHESEKLPELALAAYDLETYSPGRFSDPKLDPILMIAFAGKNRQGETFSWIYTFKEKFQADGVKIFADEKSMLQGFLEDVNNQELDGLVTYNGDRFDFPYLKDRCNVFGLKVNIGFQGSEPYGKRAGQDTLYRMQGIQHIDAYQLIVLLSRFSVLHLPKHDLESVVEGIFKVKKEKVKPTEINAAWDTGTGSDLARLVSYNRLDAEYTLKIVEKYFSLLVEISRISKQSLFDACRTSASILVENLLINKAFNEHILIPNRPTEDEVKERMAQTFEGGYVKSPVPGLHENIAVLDFRSLHPSIMISHNISPETLDCAHPECKTGKNLAPTEHFFCMQKEGFLSSILQGLLDKRMEVKKELKQFKKGTPEYEIRYARQYALKIILNSMYGLLGFARFRWYSRESARAVTTWSRHYIQESAQKAEQEGYQVLYGDTDSNFLLVPKDKTEEDVKQFAKDTNKLLPGNMELEFEGMFKRGIFVSKKEGGAAKKRYALIDFNGNLKITGFEYVRRDWSTIAKETQKKVLEFVLKEGKPEKAVAYVKNVVKQLQSGNTLKKDLVVFTQIKKPLESYDAIGPHVAAAMKAVKEGREMGVGSVIGYIITKRGKSISEKAFSEEFIKEGDYDPEYYISHQVIPAVITILKELGVNEEDLLHSGKQSSLGAFS